MFMNRYVNIGLALAMATFTGAATADLMAQAQPAKPAGGQTAKPGQDTQTAKPAQETQKPAQDTQKPARGTQPAKPANQRQFMQEGGAVNLGTVRIPRAVKAGGESLPAGSYQVRVTEQPATPPAPGQTPQYERWAEFLRGGKVVAREVVTVVPNTD